MISTHTKTVPDGPGFAIVFEVEVDGAHPPVRVENCQYLFNSRVVNQTRVKTGEPLLKKRTSKSGYFDI